MGTVVGCAVAFIIIVLMTAIYEGIKGDEHDEVR